MTATAVAMAAARLLCLLGWHGATSRRLTDGRTVCVECGRVVS